MRPLDRLSSIKVKLGVVIVATVWGTALVLAAGHRLGLSLPVRATLAALLGLIIIQILARGMTSPLREMAAAASAMARGDYGRRVRATSRDEVGELARAFNAMAAELGDADRMRRELVANVSHELRTPLGALHALLENLVDGDEKHLTPTEFDLLRTMAARPGVVFTREQLLAEVWGWRDGSGARTVDSHIRGLRRKLGSSLVRTVHGVGYALEP